MPPMETAEDDIKHIEEGRFEQRAVSIVLFLAGMAGVALGFFAPRTGGTELALGALLASLGLWTWMSDRSRPSGMKDERHENEAGEGRGGRARSESGRS